MHMFMGLYEKNFGPKILVPWDTPGVPGVAPGQDPASRISSLWFFSHPGMCKSSCSSHFYGGFFYCCGQLQTLVFVETT